MILFLKPKDYDAQDVEVTGLYWHFVDLVWMFIFPLVYLMSTKKAWYMWGPKPLGTSREITGGSVARLK